MKPLSFDKSTVFSFFVLDPIFQTDVILSPSAIGLLSSTHSRPKSIIIVTQFYCTNNDTLFSLALSDFFELVSAGFFFPSLTTNN